ncbi:hypothetical protein [Candidatus Magnetaquicoccus inordinatus]|uniref:hypothetical protein n=1 Tax=Candidatus Magnetaquicoccus inordinatus TaxID=2496818 RepID=UPI0012921E16|nr:hypothetical protein [Candidatus Magnetaquicoccus inordinatus]
MAGFALLENIISIVLVAILATGVYSMFTMVDGLSRQMLWEQKALLSLHGHLEKIVALYRYGKIQDQTVSIYGQTMSYPSGHAQPYADHAILTSYRDPYGLLETDRQRFLKTADNEGVIFHYRPSGGNTGSVADRNLVWLDKVDGIVALLSWTIESSRLTQTCFDYASGSRCLLLTAYFDFPYRLDSEGVPVKLSHSAQHTLSLQTIVGAR